jgi:hypothetical protein
MIILHTKNVLEQKYPSLGERACLWEFRHVDWHIYCLHSGMKESDEVTPNRFMAFTH